MRKVSFDMGDVQMLTFSYMVNISRQKLLSGAALCLMPLLVCCHMQALKALVRTCKDIDISDIILHLPRKI